MFAPPTATRCVAYVWRLNMSSTAKKPRLSKNGKRLGRPPKIKPVVADVPVPKPVVVETPSFWKRWFGWLV